MSTPSSLGAAISRLDEARDLCASVEPPALRKSLQNALEHIERDLTRARSEFDEQVRRVEELSAIVMVSNVRHF